MRDQKTLMLVTDAHRCRLPLVDAVRQAVDAGVDAVQLRAKTLDAKALYELAVQLRRVTVGGCLLLINDRLDVALAAGADGVHLPECGLPIAVVRRLAPAGFLAGRSVHSTAAARQAEAESADYLQLGTIFATESKPGREPAGLDLIRATAAAVRIPCLAVGGVDAGNAAAVLAAGARGIAVISAILQADSIPDAVHALRRCLGAEEPRLCS